MTGVGNLNMKCLPIMIISETFSSLNMSRRMRKPTICICQNKVADQLCSSCTADQCLCFRYTDRTISLLLIFKLLAFFCDSTGWFVSDLVGNLDCWFSHGKAQIWERKGNSFITSRSLSSSLTKYKIMMGKLIEKQYIIFVPIKQNISMRKIVVGVMKFIKKRKKEQK